MDILTYSARMQSLWTEFMAQNGYTTISTFYGDLTIADRYGKDAIKDTFNNVVASWLGSYKMFTEFIMCLNHKIWAWYEKDEDIALLYQDLWEQAQDIFSAKYEENDEVMSYYYRVTD